MEDMMESAENWWTSPQTKKFVKATEEQIVKSMEALEQACRSTTDPKVAAAYANWKTAHAFLRRFVERAEKSS